MIRFSPALDTEATGRWCQPARVRTVAALIDHEGAPDTLSILFQHDYSGRAGWVSTTVLR